MRFSYKHPLLAFALFAAITIPACTDYAPGDDLAAPEMIADGANNVARTTCTVAGKFSGNLSKISEYGVKYSTSYNFPTDATSTVTFSGQPSASVSAELESLSPNTHYYYCWYATTGRTLVTSEYGEFTTTSTSKPGFTEITVDSISENYARLHCRIIEIGDQYLVEQGISYRIKSNATASFIPVVSSSINSDREYVVELNDLSAATTYEIRPYAKNSSDSEGASGMLEGYGDTQTFTTDDRVSPEVETYDVTDVSMNSARVIANVTAAEGSYGVITERGFCYSTSSKTPTIYDKTVVVPGLTLNEVYETTLTGLDQLTTYYVRPYAKCMVDWKERVGYGTTLEFTTSRISAPQVSFTSQDDATVTISTITLQAEIENYYSNILLERGFIWSTDDRNISIDNAKSKGNYITVSTTDKVFSGTITNLEPSTYYYIRAYAIYDYSGETLSGTSDVVSISTNDISGGVFKDINCIAKSSTSLTVETGLSDMGEGVFVEKGFCWKDAGRGVPTINNCDGSIIVNCSDNYTYSTVIRGLEQGTTYNVRGYMKSTYNSQTFVVYSDALTCATNELVPAQLTSVTVSLAEETNFNVSGGVTDLGNGELLEKGFCWKVGQSPTLDNSDGYLAVNSGSNEYFTTTISNLHYNSTYYVCAYVKTQIGEETMVSYSNAISRSTKDIGISYEVSLGESYVDISMSCAETEYKNLLSEWSAAIVKEGGNDIVLNDNSYTKATSANTSDGVTQYVSHLTGLKASTTYVIRMRAKHKDGYYIYQNTDSFSSLRGPSMEELDDPYIKI
jgi:hypothetical protein